MRAARLALLVATVCLPVAPAGAFRDLGQCPDLLPLHPVEDAPEPAASCRAAIARAGRSFVAESLAAHGACLRRLQEGTLAAPRLREQIEELCRGQLRNSLDRRDLPTDGETAELVERAAAAFDEAIAAACSDADVAALALCADTLEGSRHCLLREHQEHAQHLLDESFGRPLPFVAIHAGACQEAVAAASAEFVGQRQAAMAACVDKLVRSAARRPWHALWRRARRGGADLAEMCLGAYRDGAAPAPADPATAFRFALAEHALERRVAAACSDDEVAALDTCGRDAASLASCLGCAHGREALHLAQAQLGGTPDDATTHFIDWSAVRNPVLGEPDRMLKDQTVAYRGDGWFFVFGSARFEPDDPELEQKRHYFYRTRDWLTFERLLDEDIEGVGSPDVARFDGVWHMVFQGRSSRDPDKRQIFLSTSDDLERWTPPIEIAPDLDPDGNVIDGTLARADGFYYLGYKDRDNQQFFVTRSAHPALDHAWTEAVRSLAETSNLFYGFVENSQFLEIDGRWRMIATARDLERRCFDIYTCLHEPHVYTVSGVGDGLGDWSQWEDKRLLAVPYEDWNPQMHANTGFLSDWRERDGFFYLTYSGSLDNARFERRGHGMIGIARSRDGVHWRLPGDLRD